MNMIMKRSLILFLLLIMPGFIYAQIKGVSSIDPEKIFGSELLESTRQQELLKQDVIPTGNKIDPKHYYIGPGDVLSVQSIVFSMNNELISVSPDNTILLPRIGTIDLDGKTLAQAQKIIRSAIEKRNPNSSGYVILAKPRTVLITISGNVKNPGNYYLPASYQVSTAVKVANQEKEEPSVSQIKMQAELKTKYRENFLDNYYSETGLAPEISYYKRNVYVLRNDGTSLVADFEKAMVDQNPDLDPYIMEGDVINVPNPPESYPFISINGAVKRPCRTVYKKGDKVSTLLKIGYGFTDNVNPDDIFLYIPGSQKEKLEVDKNGNLISDDKDIAPGTIINAGNLGNETKTENGIVAVSGEVKYPGTYVVKEGETKLKEIIDMAGGFTDEAYLPLAGILRPTEDFQPSQYDPRSEINKYFMHTNLTLEDTLRYQTIFQYALPIVSNDFTEAFENDSQKDNVVLYNGDLIFVPKKPGSVYVFGQVKKPGFITYVEGKNMEWYIEQAGGFAETADEDRASIIKGKNNVWLEGDDDVIVQAGDKVFVPHPPDIPPGVEIQSYALVLSAISSVTILINVLVNLF